ncbi:hypothetical protein Taro_051323 [Colocasia esculenta]|uniref:Uncharacterized protein n=1 Tax=Colocasia esculenta TaxID=4460 RepID=A0A843XFN7_COLES|nr:hypothetical protein [Colocasia esculenta]
MKNLGSFIGVLTFCVTTWSWRRYCSLTWMSPLFTWTSPRYALPSVTTTSVSALSLFCIGVENVCVRRHSSSSVMWRVELGRCRRSGFESHGMECWRASSQQLFGDGKSPGRRRVAAQSVASGDRSKIYNTYTSR